MGKFAKTIHFTIFIKLFFINYHYLGAEEGKDCCENLCPCFYKSEKSKSDIDDEEENSNINNTNNINNEEEKNKNNLIESKKTILRGLNNIGATCYMNATLQCLSNSKKLTEYFLTKYQYDPKDQNKIMTNEYYKVLKNLWDTNSKEKAYSPNSFKEVLSKENPLFAGIAANDSKDLINFLIEGFHNELNTADKNNINNNVWENVDQTNRVETFKAFLMEYLQSNQSVIVENFYGISESNSQCSVCNTTKYNFQTYRFLEFSLQQVNQYCFNIGKRPLLTNDGKNPDVDLYECFDYNEKIDLMTGDNQIYCNICKCNRDTNYRTTIYSLPNYLIINLNRGKGAVYPCNVIFPEVLNLCNYVSTGKTKMRLYAVICHLGPSSMSGHFVAYCRNRMDNKWYLYNDGIVTECTRQDQYNDGMPYILFYELV